jgi:hypothetical protein
MPKIQAVNPESLMETSPLPELTLPSNAEILKLRFSDAESGELALLQFGDPQKQWAHVQERTYTQTLNQGLASRESDLTLILIQQSATAESASLVQQVQIWFDSTTPTGTSGLGPVNSILLPLQGVHIIWQPHRAVIVTDQHRMQAVCHSLIEATYYEQTLRKIERAVDQGWQQTQSDSAFAFEFSERNMPHKKSLESRFQQVLALRIELARLTPQILVPHVYPPTIASQIGERLRDRTRMPERLELLDEKLSAQERVYDHCVQRTGEYLVARKGHMLEWVIIILLSLQSILWIIEVLSSTGS